MLKKFILLVLLASIAVPTTTFAMEDGFHMLTEKKYQSKPENSQIDFYWNASDIKKHYEEIGYLEAGGSMGMVGAVENAQRMANQKGADAILVLDKEYIGRGGSESMGVIFGKLLVYKK